MILQNAEDMENIQVTDRAVFKDAPPEVLRKLAENRQSKHTFLSIHISLHLYKHKKIFTNIYGHLMKLQGRCCRTEYEEGPWLVSVTARSVKPLMTYCSDKALRATVWDKWISRASKPHNLARVTSNSRTIETIRRHQ